MALVEATVRSAPPLLPLTAASTLWYPPFATLNRCHQSTELPHPLLRTSPRHRDILLVVSPPTRPPSFPLHASMTILWMSTKFRLPFLSPLSPCRYTPFSYSLGLPAPRSLLLSSTPARFGHLGRVSCSSHRFRA